MIDTFGEIIPLAVAASIAILPLIALIALLGTPNGGAKGVAFWLGWLIGEAALVGAVALLGSGRDYSEDSGPSVLTGIVLLVIGVGMLGLGFQQWRSRPRGDTEPEDPSWLKSLDDFGIQKSLAAALVLVFVNTKNLPMVVGAGTVIARADLGFGAAAIVAIGFAVLASLLLAAPLVVFFGLGDRADQILHSVRTWLRLNGNIVMTVVFVIVGATLIGEALKAF